ncbi:hypothetical protein C7999DRAFT_40865 [Corynascus novoguineensis]|uniref:Transcription factor TFIIIC triple barrel domain-containing protein n=1 Tax=Corynascus novoguineensis TaxID=1126955 RepID=A0AAN7HFM2_9PEZI|nr:hypothetical protein C7999DRAFT_40865 [Corynascus novoguineensis]
MESHTRPPTDALPDDDDGWEYEYSTTETETYYLTLDLSVRDFLERRTDDVVHSTRTGYRVWYNPLFNAPEPHMSNTDLLDDKDADDGEPPEREEVDLDSIGVSRPPNQSETPIDPLLEQSVTKHDHPGQTSDKRAEEIQILELHSKEPIISYRNHVFRGSWCENIGTEMIFTPHDDDAPLPALRHLPQNMDLIAASATRINCREATLVPKEQDMQEGMFLGFGYSEEDIPERYKRNGGVYVHIGGDKTGQRQPQAHFLEDLITLKRKRGETDEVTIQPLETRQNKLMVEDEEEERRRRKLQQDHARNVRWRDKRREEREMGLGSPERSYVPRTGGRRGWPKRARRAALIRRDSGAISRFERERDKHWVETSPSWVDRQACRWLGVCGLLHIRWDAPSRGDDEMPSTLDELRSLALGLSTHWEFKEKSGLSDWETAPKIKGSKRGLRAQGAGSARIMQEVPSYVLDHAPLVHLYSGEHFWPSDIAEHIRHMETYMGGELVNTTKPLDLQTLAKLNSLNSTVFLTSEDDVESRPGWLHSRVGIPEPLKDDGSDGDDEDINDPPQQPDDDGSWQDVDRDHPPHRIVPPRESLQRHRELRWRRHSLSEAQRPMVWTDAKSEEGNKPTRGGYSEAPAVLILVDKGAGIVDAFWFFFYSYNLGQTVLNIRFGNHVGDWEHCMVRFQHGVPRAMFLSEHAGGKAYLWKALEKRAQRDGKPARPVIYSAVGSHAMYASPGMHPYVLPFKLLKDVTDKGPLWDPSLNNYAYWYDYEVDREEEGNSTISEFTSLVPAASNPDLPTSWFHFEGSWGDDIYPLSDRRQWRLFGEYHYITGPLGPKAKWLDRRKVCQTEKCTIVDSIEAGKKSAWY